METLGFFLTILIGVSLGVLGGGGSILTLPLLTLFFGYSVTSATGASLFLVGITAAAGALIMARQGLVDRLTLLTFGPASILAVFLTRLLVLPRLPESLTWNGAMALSRDQALLLLFLVLMLGTAWTMIRRSPDTAMTGKPDGPTRSRYLKAAIEGLVIGFVTGLVGAGGGFLIVPALVLLAGLPMPKAVGTSLAIIAAKSLVGFGGDLVAHAEIQWPLLTMLAALAILGLFIGLAIRRWIPDRALKPAFGVFILVIAFLMAYQGFFAKSSAHTQLAPPTSQLIMPVQPLTPKELQSLRQSGSDLQLLDVRGSDEREISVLTDDIHIVMDQIAKRASELDPARTTVVYCRSGQRSQNVAEYLESIGFEDIYNLTGGINRWATEVDTSLPTY